MKIAFTGHRNFERPRGLGERLRTALEGVEHAYIGMALGFDMYAARACMHFGVPFTACVPFKGQQSRWPQEQQDLWHWLCDQADEQVLVTSGGYSAQAFELRNRYMVDRADLVLAWWDGSRSGTGNCVRYAESMRIPVVNLYA